MKETLYGRNPVRECLQAGRRQVFNIMVAQGSKEKGTLEEIFTLAQQRHVPIQHVDRRQLDQLSQEASHQGVLAEVNGYPYATIEAMLTLASRRAEPPWLLILDCLQDPQNLGTLLRTAEIVGVHGVIIPDRRAAEVTPAVVSVSSGASEHLLITQVTNLVRTMEELKEKNVWITGLEDVSGAALPWHANLSGALALVVGSEGAGMRRLVKETCDLMIRLPMYGQVHSLNAAVAGSIALYEIVRQRGKQ